MTKPIGNPPSVFSHQDLAESSQIRGAKELDSQINIEVLNHAEQQYWEAYLDSRPDATLFLRVAWDVPFAVYGLKVVRLLATQDGKPVGILPLVHQKSLLFGSHMVSLPWFDAAGILADTKDVEQALLGAALQRCRAGRADLSLRQMEPLNCLGHARTDKVLMRLELPEDSEVLWKGFSPKVRNQVRKAEKSGLVYRKDGLESFDDFYNVYSINMRDLGSPAHSRKFFHAVLTQFESKTRVHTIKLEGETIGAGLTLDNQPFMEIPWASSLRSYNSLCVNHLLYWKIIEGACKSGFAAFHFGRSSMDSGTYRFKRQWGAEAIVLHWYTCQSSGEVLEAEVRPGESYGTARRLWQKLPICISRFIGPHFIAKVA